MTPSHRFSTSLYHSSLTFSQLLLLVLLLRSFSSHSRFVFGFSLVLLFIFFFSINDYYRLYAVNTRNPSEIRLIFVQPTTHLGPRLNRVCMRACVCASAHNWPLKREQSNQFRRAMECNDRSDGKQSKNKNMPRELQYIALTKKVNIVRLLTFRQIENTFYFIYLRDVLKTINRNSNPHRTTHKSIIR